ncbi:SR-related and CTD-associated factor 4-like [Biomphalaria glabrata]|uniref:SR-related and CTD-associated factor 4-like n=1 Tax=Biomphalaria glabrata TaxID=6526 RepID=A0A2C9JKA1_BIOGL|nr:SR-related and CTD-associated factor 4-like [Biomphalaria glabrata]
MEAVRAFNNELSSLYEGKPPVSRAKMAQVTKCAIKAIKFYKHVVQSVEKFIQKCKPEYKVPGLYVIDSIVRQSRHQFGPEKDVFSPRFTKNIVNTFVNLFKCPVEERSRVVRVLNLWQKNAVFPVEVIQPLLDLAADPNNMELVTAAQRSVDAVVSVTQKVPLPNIQSNSSVGDASSNQLLQQTEMLSTITKLLQQAQEGSITGVAPESQLQQLQHLQQQLVMQTERISKPQQSTPPIDSNLLAQIQMLTNQLLSKTSGTDSSGDAVKLQKPAEPLFNKKLLEFDYGDSDEDEDRQEHHHHHHHVPQHQPQQRQPMVNNQQGYASLIQGIPGLMPDSDLLHQIQQMSQQQEQLQSEIGAQDLLRRRLLEQQQQQFDREIEQATMIGMQEGFNNQDVDNRHMEEQEDRNMDNRDRNDRRRQRDTKEESRSPRRRPRRSRSRSREKRRRSRSRDRHRRSRSRDRERRDREKERERRKRGLPSPKDRHISICSMTLWFGHLTKHTTEEELREHIEKYGTIKTINMIPPRGCAFVCLTKRKDAFKALDRLKGVKVNGNALKVAWAPGIGVKESIFKDLWDVEQGVTYIPWDQLPADITPYIAGGMVDVDTLPEKLKGINTGEEDIVEEPQQLNQMNDGMMMSQQQMSMNMPNQPSNFPMPGHSPINMMGPNTPLGMLSAPPPLGIRPGMGGPNLQNIGAPNAMGGPNMNVISGLGAPRPGLLGAGIRPAQINIGPQGPLNNQMMGGQGTRMGGAPSPRMDMHSSPMGINSPGPRGPFPPFGAMPRFPIQGPGGIRGPFFNNNECSDNDGNGMGDRDLRGMAEPKEWPPDDEVNAEDEPDEDMDSDERIMMNPGNGPRLSRPGLHNPRTLNLQFRGPGPMVPGQRPPNQMLQISSAQSPNAGMPSLLSLRMLPPGQQQSVLAVQTGPSPGFTLAPGGVRMPMSAVGVRAGLVQAAPSPRLLPPSTGSLPVSVSVNGSVVMTRPGLPNSNLTIVGAAGSPDITISNPDIPQPSDEDLMGNHPPGPVPLMQIQGGNRQQGGPILGRGFAPMTIRPRGGPGLLGVRPGAQGGNFSRFSGPRPLMGPGFGMERPSFGNRFGMALRPPIGFLDQDEREDKDDRRMLPRMDQEEPKSSDVDERKALINDLDERRVNEEKVQQDGDERVDIDERPKATGRSSGRPSRWSNVDNNEESFSESSKICDENKIAGSEDNSKHSASVSLTEAPSIVPEIDGCIQNVSAASEVQQPAIDVNNAIDAPSSLPTNKSDIPIVLPMEAELPVLVSSGATDNQEVTPLIADESDSANLDSESVS